MNTLKQLLRQPLKSLLGILAMALAVTTLCICISQALVATRTVDAIAQRYTSVALMTIHCNETAADGGTRLTFHLNLPENVDSMIQQMHTDHPEIVQAIINPGLASAYIPSLAADNLSQYLYYNPGIATGDYMAHYWETTPSYAGGIFEVLITEIGDPYTASSSGTAEDGSEVSLARYIQISITGTVESVLSLEEGYDDPTGRTARITLELAPDTDLDALNLEVGGRYLVYTADYQDGEWILKGNIAYKLSQKTNEAIDWREINTDAINTNSAAAYYQHGMYIAEVRESELRYKDAVVMTVQDLSDFGTLSWVEHENGKYPVLDYSRYVTDENGQQVQLSEEEWQARYSVPTMARLDGSAEDFLNSEAGALWRQYLDITEQNQQVFPVIGVENLNYIANFAQGTARIVEGRDFTQEELRSGANVCILSETLAAANGLSVGDTICPQFYNSDYDDPNQEFLSDGKGVVNPWAYRLTGNTQWVGEPEAYTIVGLYRQSNAWGNVGENLYAFTPNTIFVPHSAVPSDMDYSNQGFFQTLVLQNGKIEEFNALVAEADCGDYFICYDQGYSLVSGTITAYQQLAPRAITVGLAAYGVIFLLFLLLFPGSQGKVLRTMTALGATRGQKIRQIVLSSAGILVPGALAGLIAGYLLWDKVVAWLAESAQSTLTLEMDAGQLALIALAQLMAALALTTLLALPLTRSRGLARRRRA